MRKPTILAVDDNPGNLVALEAVLDADFTVVRATSGADALAILHRRSDISVILMDVQMPVLDGFATAERIKLMPGCQDLPIVFITAVHHEDPHVKRGYQVGGVDYFTKPFDPQLLRLKMGIYASFREKAALLGERERHVREAEELLKASRRFSTVVENLPVGVLVVDLHGQIHQISDEVRVIFKAKELTDASAYTALLEGWEPDYGSLIRTLWDAGAVHDQLVRVRCVDRSTKTIVASMSPLVDVTSSYKLAGAVVVVKDTTECRRVATEFVARVDRLASLAP